MAELVCGTSDREAWLAARREGITATDIVTIMSLVSWDSPWALYHRKLGLLPEVEQSDRMRLGSWLEESISFEWGQRTHMHYPVEQSGGLYQSSIREWQLATPDSLVMDKLTSRVCAVLECKTSATRDGWGEDGSSDVPAHVRAQVLWQMDTLDMATGHVAVVFLPSGEFRSYTVEHEPGCPATGIETKGDCSACGDIDLQRQAGDEFMARLRGELPTPPLDGSQPTLDAVKYLNASVVKGKAAEFSQDMHEEWVHVCDMLDHAEERKREMSSRIRQQMGDAQLAVCEEGSVFARREVFKRAESVTRAHEVDRLVRVKPGKDKSGD